MKGAKGLQFCNTCANVWHPLGPFSTVSMCRVSYPGAPEADAPDDLDEYHSCDEENPRNRCDKWEERTLWLLAASRRRGSGVRADG